MFLNLANQVETNDTSASIEYDIDRQTRVSNEIVAEGVSTGYKTDDLLESAERLPLAKATFDSRDMGKAEVESFASSREEKAVFEKFEQRILRKLRFPTHWGEEGIAKPNAAAKEKALAICRKLFKKDMLIPDLILSSKEEGIYLSYDRITEGCDRSLIIEVYNTLETALIVCDNFEKKTIYSEDVSDMEFSRAVEEFKA